MGSFMETVRDNIRQRREEKNLSQRELSLMSGFSNSYIYRVETGQQSPSLEGLQSIATALGVSVSELTAEEQGTSGPRRPTRRNGHSWLSPPRFRDRLNQEMSRSARYHRPLSVLMIKPRLDNGHELDRRTAVAQLAPQLRVSDIVALWTPPYLCVACTESSGNQAQLAAERIHSNFASAENGRWCIGITESSPSLPDVKTLLARAIDAAREAERDSVPIKAL